MADDTTPRLRIPDFAKKGELVEVKTLSTHPMESGQRKDAEGKPVSRVIVNSLKATFNDKPVVNAKLEPAVAANPYLSFFVQVEKGGSLKPTWTDDLRNSWAADIKIEVS